MPFYRFMIEGTDSEVPNGDRGFLTTRHAFGTDEAEATIKVFERLRKEFTSGASAHIWRSRAPALTVHSVKRIGWHQLFSAPNRGSTFYDEREGRGPLSDLYD
jgi:hypothetical protein